MMMKRTVLIVALLFPALLVQPCSKVTWKDAAESALKMAQDAGARAYPLRNTSRRYGKFYSLGKRKLRVAEMELASKLYKRARRTAISARRWFLRVGGTWKQKARIVLEDAKKNRGYAKPTAHMTQKRFEDAERKFRQALKAFRSGNYRKAWMLGRKAGHEFQRMIVYD